MKVKDIFFPENQYFREVFQKKQIVLHHTVSNPFSASGDIASWKSTPGRIATYGILDYNGVLTRCFDSGMWAHHLGLKSKSNLLLNQRSIAVELDCWGGLVQKKGRYVNVYGGLVDYEVDVVEVKWRGFEYFQSYSDIQIESLAELLSILMRKHGIPNRGLKDGNFDVREDALSGDPGIYSHSNFRPDKSDLYPDSRIVNMLRNI